MNFMVSPALGGEEIEDYITKTIFCQTDVNAGLLFQEQDQV